MKNEVILKLIELKTREMEAASANSESLFAMNIHDEIKNLQERLK